MSIVEAGEWSGPSRDPNDEQFGDVVTRATLEDGEDHEVLLVGEPYDGAVVGRQGAADGPSEIRKTLASVKTHHVEEGPVSAIGDLGDVAIPDGPPGEVHTAIRKVTEEVHRLAATPLFIGGDNSLTSPNVEPLLDQASVGVLSFDAHLDCRAVRDQPTSGTPYRQLHERGLSRLAVLGARHFETSTPYHEYLNDHGGVIETAPTLSRDPVETVRRTLDTLGTDVVYISVDIDVLDAAAAPGVSAPTPGGIRTIDLFEAVRVAAADDRVAGLEVVECAPALDRGGRTVAAAARTIAHAVSGVLR